MKYDEIINLERFNPKHPRMPIYKRASIFAPFAALTGYGDMVYEAGRFTKKKRKLLNEEKLVISDKLEYVKNNLLGKKEIMVIYFAADKRKKGGKYISKYGVVKRIDLYNRNVIFMDKNIINFDNIIEVNF